MCLYCDVGVLDERLVDQKQEMVFVEEECCGLVVVVCCCDCDEQARGLQQQE